MHYSVGTRVIFRTYFKSFWPTIVVTNTMKTKTRKTYYYKNTRCSIAVPTIGCKIK